MIRSLYTYRIISIALGMFFCSYTIEAAQSTVTSAVPHTAVSASEDSGTWRRDPFIGSVKKGEGPQAAKGIPLKTGAGASKQEQEQNFQLQGIMLAGKRFHALINGRSVKVGDTIGGVTVKQISRYQVIVLNERKEKIIYDIYQGRIDRGKQ
jgi:hypothetical protein